MKLFSPKRHGLFGQGQSVINAVTIAAGCGMLVRIQPPSPSLDVFNADLIFFTTAARLRSRSNGRAYWDGRDSFHDYLQ